MLISHASKVMFKILQAKLYQYVNLQMYKLNFEATAELEINLAEMSRVRQEGHSLPSQGTSETGLLGGAKTRWSREHLGGVVGNMARGSA